MTFQAVEIDGSYQTATGSLTAVNDTVGVDNLIMHSTVVVQFSTVLFSGTVDFEGSINGSDYLPIPVHNISSGDAVTQTTASDGLMYRAAVAGFKEFRVRVSAHTTGSVTVDMRATHANAGAYQAQAIQGTGTPGSPTAKVVTIQGTGAGTDVNVAATSLPLPTGAATEAKQDTLIGHVDGVEALLTTIDTDTSTLAAVDYATQTTLASILVDTGQIEALLTTIDADTSVLAAVDYATQTTLATLATEAKLEAVRALLASIDADTSALAAVDYATSAQLPPALVGNRLDQNIGSWLGSTVPTVGQKAMASSVPVVMASNQTAIPVTFTQAGARTGVSGAFLALGGGSAGVLQTLRATTYTEPASAAQRSMSSSSASDTSAGTGARTVEITYYDNTGVGPLTETVTLNGTSSVNTVATNIRFIESMRVVTAGSGGANVGTITLFGSTGGGGGTVGTIGVGNLVTAVGDNQTFWAHHYVAATYTVELSSLIAGVQSGGSATSGRFFLRSSQPLVANSAEIVVGGAVLIEGSFERSYEFNPKVVGFARITAYAIPAVNNATVSLTFDWSEVLT